MRAVIRKQVNVADPYAFEPTRSRATLHVWRSGGVGDFVYMEPAIRRHKAAIPERQIILHAPVVYDPMWRHLGFDGFVANETSTRQGSGIDLHWVIENHVGAYCLDRVSIWEDAFQLDIGTDSPTINWPRGWRDRAVSHENYVAGKPLLFFAPFTSSAGLAGRSLETDHVNILLSALRPCYNVVMALGGPNAPAEVNVQGIMAIRGTTQAEFFDMASGCDLGLANDSGSLYWMAANGIPCVGLYDHVQPWLRCYRFPQIKPVISRWPVCQCHHHGGCTRAEKGQAPCKAVPADFLLHALSDCIEGDRSLVNPWQTAEGPPSVEGTITGDGDRRATEVCLDAALRALPGQSGTVKYHLDLQAGQVFEKKDLWQSLTLMETPNADTSRMKLPLRRVQRGDPLRTVGSDLRSDGADPGDGRT